MATGGSPPEEDHAQGTSGHQGGAGCSSPPGASGPAASTAASPVSERPSARSTSSWFGCRPAHRGRRAPARRESPHRPGEAGRPSASSSGARRRSRSRPPPAPPPAAPRAARPSADPATAPAASPWCAAVDADDLPPPRVHAPGQDARLFGRGLPSLGGEQVIRWGPRLAELCRQRISRGVPSQEPHGGEGARRAQAGDGAMPPPGTTCVRVSPRRSDRGLAGDPLDIAVDELVHHRVVSPSTATRRPRKRSIHSPARLKAAPRAFPRGRGKPPRAAGSSASRRARLLGHVVGLHRPAVGTA